MGQEPDILKTHIQNQTSHNNTQNGTVAANVPKAERRTTDTDKKKSGSFNPTMGNGIISDQSTKQLNQKMETDNRTTNEIPLPQTASAQDVAGGFKENIRHETKTVKNGTGIAEKMTTNQSSQGSGTLPSTTKKTKAAKAERGTTDTYKKGGSFNPSQQNGTKTEDSTKQINRKTETYNRKTNEIHLPQTTSAEKAADGFKEDTIETKTVKKETKTAEMMTNNKSFQGNGTPPSIPNYANDSIRLDITKCNAIYQNQSVDISWERNGIKFIIVKGQMDRPMEACSTINTCPYWWKSQRAGIHIIQMAKRILNTRG